MALLEILQNIQRTYTYPSQTLSKDWRGGNTPKVILWCHHHPNTKTRQNTTKKRKLHANIFDKYRCKNPQQNISKPNPRTHEKDYTPWSSWIHPKITRMAQHMQNQCDIPHKKDKNHTIINRCRKSI